MGEIFWGIACLFLLGIRRDMEEISLLAESSPDRLPLFSSFSLGRPLTRHPGGGQARRAFGGAPRLFRLRAPGFTVRRSLFVGLGLLLLFVLGFDDIGNRGDRQGVRTPGG